MACSQIAPAKIEFPINPGASREARKVPRTSLPKMWPGYVLAVLCFLAFVRGAISEEGSALALAGVLSLIGRTYWLYCLYRIHTVLSEASSGSYRVKPFKSVGMALIPIGSFIWNFYWPREIDIFLKRNGATRPLKHRTIGVALLIVKLLNLLPTGFNLALNFAVGTYVKKRLAELVTWAVRRPERRREQINFAMSAGLAAGCGFMLSQALIATKAMDRTELLCSAAAIALASMAALRFVEPLAERCRGALGIHHEHAPSLTTMPAALKLSLISLLVFTSASHGLLHEYVANALTSEPSETTLSLIRTLLFAGGITYFWVSGARRSTRNAAITGTIGGAFMGFTIVIIVWVFNFGRLASNLLLRSAHGVLHHPISQLWDLSWRLLWDGLLSLNHPASLRKAIMSVALGMAFGFAGGIVIRTKQRGTIAFRMLVTLVLAGFAFAFVMDRVAPLPGFSVPNVLSRRDETVIGLDGERTDASDIANLQSKLAQKARDPRVRIVHIAAERRGSKQFIDYEIFRHDIYWRIVTLVGFAIGWCAGLFVYPNAEAILTGKTVRPEPAPGTFSAAA